MSTTVNDDATAAAVSTSEETIKRWRDKKKYLWPFSLLPALAVFIAWGLVELTGSGIFWWGGFPIVFGLIPLLDVIIGDDGENPPDEVMEELENDPFYRWMTYLYIPIQYAGLGVAVYFWATGSLSVFESIGLATTVAITSGIGINVAHELGHKKEENERWASRIVLAQSFYGHFYIEHNRGHHVRVATPEDPASSRFGESFYHFLPRTVTGAITSAWELEKKRFERLGQSHWTLKNDVLNAWLMSVALFGGILIGLQALSFAGVLTDYSIWNVLPYLVIQAILGFSLLEVVNYLEHYGLKRQKLESGRYERCQPKHSWNSDRIVTNIALYQLQRHSDHHANPTRRYQTLRSFDEAPMLPGGYATMMVVAVIPPLWRKIMDHRVLDHYDGDITKANIYPPKRDKILAKYGQES
ncbi:alkane 1-monooxygenase [Hoyosella rhizosphaerae]|uniref:Alkane 1-monooxygenase n=1 Tax=Hoyosella rhizosphaerae TaxID=1755582 RepID=A0A916XH39_9ACTN|nr:alkane 1-monooxygenase [Hoyosella rhizosphaerae]MBN4927982.1 alkane 1-monooxygenase [Hoyosella rhizosphaerae]GGC71426.1 alkane 1-monooxygenase [Hoyosella rhizosphaerae]